MAIIGELNQSDLHEQLKQAYRGPDGETEVTVDGYVVDVRLPHELVEIQTGRLGKLRAKLEKLARRHRIRLVHPVYATKVIARVDRHANVLSRRRSPKKGRLEDAFEEIDDIAGVLAHPNVTLEIPLVDVTEYRRDDGRGSWRRRGVSIVGRRLDRIVSRREFRTPADYGAVLPGSLGRELTNADVSELTGLHPVTAQSITRALRKIGALSVAGKRGRWLLYRRCEEQGPDDPVTNRECGARSPG